MKKYKKLLLFFIPFIILFFILLIFWPGIYTYDGNIQWGQVVNNNISNDHPFFSTFVLLILSKIWNNQTVLLIFQIFLFSLIWKNICNELINENKKIRIIIIYTIVLCLFPIVSIYSITAWKDVIYSYCLFATAYVLYKGTKINYDYSKTQFCLIGILVFSIFNYRHNGIIVSMLLFIILFILLVKNKISIKKSLLALLTFILLFITTAIPKNYYLKKYDKKSESVPTSVVSNYVTWMMGAHLQNNYIEEKDLNFLDNCIDIEEWKKAYSPFLINGVNLSKSKNSTFINENSAELRNIFIKYTLKHPITVAIHYLKADALLWSPLPVGYVYQYDFKEWGPDYGFAVKNTSIFPVLNKEYEKIVTLTMRKPIRVILYQPATIMYISIILTLILVKSLKNKKLWIILLPMLLNIASLLPINLAQDLRYVYINYLTLAFIGILVVVNYQNVKEYLFSLTKRGDKNAKK